MGRPASGSRKTVSVTLRIDPVTDQLWEDTARMLGLSKVALAEMAIRKVARAEGIEERPAKESANE
jgi:hypothetical protein